MNNATAALTITEATNYLPTRNGKKVHRLTVLRWIRKGIRGVRLNAWKDGDMWLTTEADLEDFRMAMTQRSLKDGSQPVPLSPSLAERHRRAMEVLERDYFPKPRKAKAKKESPVSHVR